MCCGIGSKVRERDGNAISGLALSSCSMKRHDLSIQQGTDLGQAISQIPYTE
jgi:hypothetical protein